MIGSWLMIGTTTETEDQVVDYSPPGSPHSDNSESIDSGEEGSSNSELAAPLADIIEKQRRLSESASQTIQGPGPSRVPRSTPDAPPAGGVSFRIVAFFSLVVFGVGFVSGYLLRGSK